MSKIFTCLFFTLLIVLLMSCSIDKMIINDLSNHQEINLADYVSKDFDYILILFAGTSLREVMADSNLKVDISNEEPRVGERIFYIKNESIVKQYNLPLYVSEAKQDYLSFFEYSYLSPTDEYMIVNKGQTVFKHRRAKINNKYDWYFLEPAVPTEHRRFSTP